MKKPSPDTEPTPSKEIAEASVDREELFIEALSQYPTIKEAALAAGYAPGYATGRIYHKFNSDRFVKRLQKRYNGFSASLLPAIHRIDRKVIDKLQTDIESVPKYEKTIKRILTTAGVLKQDIEQRIDTVNIKVLQQFMHQASQTKAIDAEVIDSEWYSDMGGGILNSYTHKRLDPNQATVSPATTSYHNVVDNGSMPHQYSVSAW